MGVVDTLAGAWLERIAARHDDAARRTQRKEHRLLERRRPDVRRERLATHEHVHPPIRLARHDFDVVRIGGGLHGGGPGRARARAGAPERRQYEGKREGKCGATVDHLSVGVVGVSSG
jgi:hypothetical protein